MCSAFYPHHVVRTSICYPKVAITYEGDVMDTQLSEWNERVITICCFPCSKKGSRQSSAVNHRETVRSKLNWIYETNLQCNNLKKIVVINAARYMCVLYIASTVPITSIYLCVSYSCFFWIVHVISNRCKCLTIVSNQLSLLEIYFSSTCLNYSRINVKCSHSLLTVWILFFFFAQESPIIFHRMYLIHSFIWLTIDLW